MAGLIIPEAICSCLALLQESGLLGIANLDCWYLSGGFVLWSCEDEADCAWELDSTTFSGVDDTVCFEVVCWLLEDELRLEDLEDVPVTVLAISGECCVTLGEVNCANLASVWEA